MVMRFFSILLIFAMSCAALAGCSSGYITEETERFFTSENIPLPAELSDIYDFAISGDLLYIAAPIIGESQFPTIYTMDINGAEPGELENYSSPRPPDGAMGFVLINNLIIDVFENIWIVETGSFSKLDLPDGFDAAVDDPWQYYRDLESIMSLRKLDATGKELGAFDLRIFSDNETDFFIRAISSDNNGNIYIANTYEVIVFDNSANLLFDYNSASEIDDLVKLADGTVASFFRGTPETNPAVFSINIISRQLENQIELPINAGRVHSGAGDHIIFFSDFTGLSGIKSENDDSERLITWIDSNINIDGILSVDVLSNGQILLAGRMIDHATGSPETKLSILTETSYESISRKTVLTLATLFADQALLRATADFNSSSDIYHIQIVDYSIFATGFDYQAGRTRLLTDIIAGRTPDILDTSHVLVNQFVNKGLLVDLYPFIDSDPHLNRGDLVENVMKLSEIDGGFYRVYPGFGVSTLIGQVSTLGEGKGWSLEEFAAVLEANQQADRPLGGWFDRAGFLTQTVFVSLSQFVNLSEGTCSFDTDDFAHLIEVAGMLPAERNNNYVEEDLIVSGRQIMTAAPHFSDIRRIRDYSIIFGGDIVFKGYPTTSGIGNTISLSSELAITGACIDVDGAWEFLRLFLTKDFQIPNKTENFHDLGTIYNFPSNRHAFEKLIKAAMTPKVAVDFSGNEREVPYAYIWGDLEIEIYAITESEANQIVDLVNTASFIRSNFDDVILDIVRESTSTFFAGHGTSADATRIIQNRVSRILSEQE